MPSSTATNPAPVYMTPACARRLKAELKDILYKQRPEMANTAAWAASNGDRSENADYQYAKRKLRQLDGRIRFLSKRLENAMVVDPLEQQKVADGKVFFGCTVTVENEAGEQRVFSIVGADEFDLSRGYVSWVSPIGRALLGKSVDDVVSVATPGGRTELEIIRLEYKSLE